MIKMLTTQLSGAFERIYEKEELRIEDAARALSQAIVGEGHVYVIGTGEMRALHDEVESGPEALPKTTLYTDDTNLSHIDRVIIASRYANDEEALALTKKVQAQDAQVIHISASIKEGNPIQELADFYIDTHISGPMLPFDMDRIGFPSIMGMLYVYHALFVITKEIISEYE
ncbi:DUF2529 family protein [Pontibacillus yanchengensis]|nr:DUF2529 family protein [Pontibacillus yanchengensis]